MASTTNGVAQPAQSAATTIETSTVSTATDAAQPAGAPLDTVATATQPAAPAVVAPVAEAVAGAATAIPPVADAGVPPATQLAEVPAAVAEPSAPVAITVAAPSEPASLSQPASLTTAATSTPASVELPSPAGLPTLAAAAPAPTAQAPAAIEPIPVAIAAPVAHSGGEPQIVELVSPAPSTSAPLPTAHSLGATVPAASPRHIAFHALATTARHTTDLRAAAPLALHTSAVPTLVIPSTELTAPASQHAASGAASAPSRLPGDPLPSQSPSSFLGGLAGSGAAGSLTLFLLALLCISLRLAAPGGSRCVRLAAELPRPPLFLSPLEQPG